MPELSAETNYRLRSQVSIPKLIEGGEVAHWWCTHISECMPTAMLHSAQPTAELEQAPMHAIFDIEADTDFGTYSLRDFLVHPQARGRGFLVVKNGRIVAESYPDLRPEQPHLWASCAKPMAGLMIEHLIDDGLIGEARTLGDYVPALRDTDWASVTVRDTLDMSPGMDCEDTTETRDDPNSNAIRAYCAEFNVPFRGKMETLLEVLQDVPRQCPPGEKFEYSSPCTQILVFLAEAVSGKRWADLFRERVWAHVRADGPVQVHLTPDGVACAHGIVSSTLRDMARFGMLYTPSWNKVATRQIVSEAVIARIRGAVRTKKFFMDGFDGPVFVDRLGTDEMLGNARQWDCIWPDGDLYKGGLMDQGLYVSPDRDLVIAYFSTTPEMQLTRYLRPIATSDLLA
ncbi:serine hydrolase domain-containing protein [Ruegeria marina]|uniref:CubicO group peptidase, beta-lactamase class C family n=1 Tax=Ruegeria marina TaxID=639004 RepID=A0A1G7EDD2_9RHOB|nr:serine hydrolase domain-containing protein [Ruegeria marina]SDE61456.1 CubicO group peptidase, beta-lactamase class C family [Ruegeria marina]